MEENSESVTQNKFNLHISRKRLSLIIAGALVIAAIVLAVLISDHQNENGFSEKFTVNERDIVTNVLVSSRVVPSNKAELGFEQTGKVADIYVSEGDTVKRGQRLIQQSLGTLSSQLTEAGAQVDLKQAELDELLSGTRSEEIEVKKREQELELQKLENKYTTALLLARDAYTTADDVIRTNTDEFFEDPESATPELSFDLLQYPAVTNRLEFGRLNLGEILAAWNSQTQSTQTRGEIEQLLTDSISYLSTLRSFLDDAAFAVNNVKPAANLTSAMIASWQTDVAISRTSVNTELSIIQSHLQDLTVQKTQVAKKADELALLENGPTDEVIRQKQALLKQAQAQESKVRSQINQRILTAPFEGTVTNISIERGEIAGAQEHIITVISSNQQEIVADIPEVDIGSVQVGNPAKIVFDAIEDQSFTGTITFVDSAETIRDGVPVYEVTVMLNNDSPILRPGLTGTLTIETGRLRDVLAIPARFIEADVTGEFVWTKNNDEWEQIRVEVGQRGIDGFVEVPIGLRTGDIIYLRTNS
jgi:HlyD family secretion protein